MFFRKVGITLALATLCAFTAAAVTTTTGTANDTAVYGKRQDRLAPAGGFDAARHPAGRSGYGVDVGTALQLSMNAGRS